MTKKELKAKIRAKQKEYRELNSKIMASRSIEEVRSIEDSLKKIRDDLDELEAQLDEMDDKGEPDPDNGARSLNPMLTFRNANKNVRGADGLTQIASITLRNGTAASNSVESLALRSSESMITRVVGNRTPLDLGKYVRGMVTGNWENAPEERSAFTTTATGVIIPQVCSAEIIDTARNISLFASAGVPVIPMPEGNLTIARVKNDPVFSFKPEGEEQADRNDFELDGVELTAKTCYGYAYVSLEAIHSARNLADIIRRVFSQAMADAIDIGMLYGQSANQAAAPKGIMNDPEVNTITATNEGYSDFVKAIGAVRRANGTPSVMGINADTEEILSLMQDANKQPLNAPKSVEELTRIVSNQLKHDASKGSDALVFDPKAMVIGMQNNIVIRMFQDSDYCVKNGMVGFQIYCMLDSVAIRPSHISKITGIGKANE